MVSSATTCLSFGAAVELAVAMPLSWLPLISDYTREAKEPVKATAVSAVVYGTGQLLDVCHRHGRFPVHRGVRYCPDHS